jgi:hypothetical protein
MRKRASSDGLCFGQERSRLLSWGEVMLSMQESIANKSLASYRLSFGNSAEAFDSFGMGNNSLHPFSDLLIHRAFRNDK